MKVNKYYLRARLFPAMLTAIPAILLYYFLIGTKLADAVNFVITLPVILHVSISAALVYSFTLLNRFLGIEIFQKLYFNDELYMPTTNFLLASNDALSSVMKTKIKQKIHRDFDIRLPSLQQEQQDAHQSRKQIVFAVSQMRNKTRGNELLLQHNYEYGFIRNFLGGCVFALIACSVNILIFKNYFPHPFALKVSLALGIFYLIFILLSKWLMKRHGNIYAKVLFEQYLQS
ncbi:MAG: hypothetical protein E6Q24_01375 [Chitinophagaceae bacterium]|nr:MAG: hypothetical protein E6Q24_01375 [Chitinophagaceae bacterium]